jgi:hypothetical protein
VVAHNVRRSADPVGSARDPSEEVHVDLGARIPHVWMPGEISTLDLLGDGLTLFTGPWDVALPGGGPPVTERRLDAITARALRVPHGSGLLVRPDGVPAGIVQPWAMTSPRPSSAARTASGTARRSSAA